MKGIYLGSCKAYHQNYDIVYQDIDGKRDIGGSMTDIDLNEYDYIICTPPCNYYSLARGPKWHVSWYALNTMQLLPAMLWKLARQDKPFLIENVSNWKMFESIGLFEIAKHYGVKWQKVGRHTYWSNIDVDLNCEQFIEFRYGGYKDKNNKETYRQGGENVHKVVEKWLAHIQ